MPEARPVQEVDFDPVGHVYRRNGIVVPHVTEVIARAGKCDWSFVEEELRIHSLKRGQSVHWLTQLDDEGALNYRKVPLGLRGYRKGYRLFRVRTGFCPILVEHIFASEYGFAGRIDRFGWFANQPSTRAILDIKTGAIQDYTKLQLAAYCLGIAGNPSIARTIRRIALRLQADGTYRVKEWPRATFDRDLSEFMEALKTCQ